MKRKKMYLKFKQRDNNTNTCLLNVLFKLYWLDSYEVINFNRYLNENNDHVQMKKKLNTIFKSKILVFIIYVGIYYFINSTYRYYTKG